MAHFSYKVLVGSHVKIIEEVAKNPNSLSGALFQKGIISEGIRDEIQLDSIGDTQKARKLAICLENIIKTFPHRYEDIIEILREDFGDLVVALKNKEAEILLAGDLSETQSQATIISNESEQDDDLCIRLECGCGHCEIEDFMQGEDCPCTGSTKLSLFKNQSERIGKTEMTYSAYRVALQCQAAHMHASYRSFISNTVNELKKKHALPVITKRLKALLTPQGATKSLYSRMYTGDQRERLRDVRTYEELEKYLDTELCSWFNIEVIKGLRTALSIQETDKNVRAYEELQRQYMARCCIYCTVDSHFEIVCKLPTDFRKVKDKQLKYFEYKLRQTITDMSECKRRVDEASGEMVFEIKRFNTTARVRVREELTPVMEDTPMIEVMEDIPVMEDVQPILLLGTLNHPRSRCMRKSIQRQVLCYWLLILCLMVVFSTLYAYLLYGPTTVYLYGQDVVLLATESDFDSIDFFNKIPQQNRSQIDIYVGNPTVYNESIFKQGNVQPQSRVLVDREYLTPDSTLTVQLQPGNVNETNFMTTVAIRNILNGTHAKTIVTSPSNFTWTFNKSNYYNIWIQSSVQLNYTITGEVYRYNASDLTLGCSIPADQDSCCLTRQELNGLDTNEVYIFGIVSTTRDTITKLRYKTVDNGVHTGFLIVSAVEYGLMLIVCVLMIILCATKFRQRY